MSFVPDRPTRRFLIAAVLWTLIPGLSAMAPACAVDELTACLGVVVATCDPQREWERRLRGLLTAIQARLFDLGGQFLRQRIVGQAGFVEQAEAFAVVAVVVDIPPRLLPAFSTFLAFLALLALPGSGLVVIIAPSGCSR